MKILLLGNNLTNGGLQRVLSLWARGFVNEGYEVSLVLMDTQLPVTFTVPSTIKTYQLDTPECNIMYLSLWVRNRRWRKEFRGIISEAKPNVIISLMPELSFAAYLAAKKFKIPFIHTEHNAFERPDYVKMGYYTKFEKFILNRFYDRVTVLCDADKSIIGKKIKNVTVLPNPTPYEPSSNVPTKKKMVFAAGRLDAWHYKGFDLLLKAWKGIAEKDSDWQLVIAGISVSGKGEAFLKEMTKDLGIEDCVHFVGFKEDMLPLYQEAAIFVLSSRYEGWGVVLTEAMSQGCACVACDFNGRQAEILTNEKEGLLCRPNDVAELESAITRLISDEPLRIRLGEKAMERSEFFSIDNTTKRWNEIFREMNLI